LFFPIQSDLALLDVHLDAPGASDFWVGIPPLEFGDVPALREHITVIGYPTGGDNISVTTGVVSRVDITEYTHGGTKLLAVQIDAAINGGNSGGPAFQGTRVAGVAFETLNDAENIGYLIPGPIVKQFLRGVQRSGCAQVSAEIPAPEISHSPLVYIPTTPALPAARRPVMLSLFCDLGCKFSKLESVHMKVIELN
jgi:S1-C subfamily serine protease